MPQSDAGVYRNQPNIRKGRNHVGSHRWRKRPRADTWIIYVLSIRQKVGYPEYGQRDFLNSGNEMRLFATLATLCGAAGLCLGVAPVAGVAPAIAQSAGGAAQSQIVVAGTPRYKAYRINPGDDLNINVWGEERLQREAKVLPDGTFSFPLVGQLVAVNKLPSEVAADITNGLKAQYRDNVPTVTVSVKGASGLQFSVAGKVKAPGTFTPGRYVNAVEALIMAGGPAEFSNVDDVTILRKMGSGRLTSFKVRMGSIFKGNPSARDLADLPEIESGDVVIVP